MLRLVGSRNRFSPAAVMRAPYFFAMSRNTSYSRRNPVCTPSHLKRSKECTSAPKWALLRSEAPSQEEQTGQFYSSQQ